MNFFTWNILKKRLIAVRYLMLDKTVPKRKKALVIFGLIYLFMPFDLVPVFIFPFAWMDDLVLWIYIIWNLKDYLDRYWMGEKTVDIKSKFKDKKIIDIDENDNADDNGNGENDD